MKRLLIIQLLLLIAFVSFAQKETTFTMQGMVIDPTMNNDPLIGVNVTLKDRPGVGTATDVDGKFSIKVNRGDILVFAYMGYENQEYPVRKEEKNLKIALKPSSTQMDDIVVVGLGSQRKISVSGAITLPFSAYCQRSFR